MNRYKVYMEFLEEYETEAPTPQTAMENFRAMLQLYTIDEVIEMCTFTVDDLTNNQRTDIIVW